MDSRVLENPIGELSQPESVNHQYDEFIEVINQLKLNLADKSSECERIQIRLSESSRDIDNLNRELNECKSTMFEDNEDSKKTREEMIKSKKLEEDYVKLMSEFLKLGEKNDRHQQELFDVYLSKSNAINNLECLNSSGTFENELSECKLELDNRIAEVHLVKAELRNLEEENTIKDKYINELRKSLADARITHKHEITVLEEYIQSLKNTISSYEKTLVGFIESKLPSLETGVNQVTNNSDASIVLE